MDEAFPPAHFDAGRPLSCDFARDRDWSDCWRGPAGPSLSAGRNRRRNAAQQARERARSKDALQRRHAPKSDPEYMAELARVMRYLLIDSRPPGARPASLPGPVYQPRVRHWGGAGPALAWLKDGVRRALQGLQRPAVALTVVLALMAAAVGLLLL